MNRTLFHKLLRDLWGHRTRTLLVLLSLTIGIFAVAVVSDSYAILLREMNENYLRTDPSSATLWVSPLDESVLERVKKLPGVSAADLRSAIRGRIRIGENEWKTIELFVIRDYQAMPLDRIFSEKGEWPPADGGVWIERAAVRMFSAQPGDELEITIPGGSGGRLRFAGTVHAPGLAPAWMEGILYGYITPATVAMLGGTAAWQELRVTLADPALGQEGVRARAGQIADELRREGYTVSRIEVPKPGEHPHAAQMSTLLFLLEAFGLLALILSSVLAANMISAMMAREIRQIGVMKTLGAGPAQVAALYLTTVGFLGALAILLALPAGYAGARAYAAFGADMLNFDIFRNDVPGAYWLMQIGLGALLPLLVAALPILRGSRISVREAITDFGISAREFGRGSFERLLARLRFLPRLSLLAIRNSFRRRMRAALTVLTLAAAGTSFITAMTVYASMNGSVDAKFAAIRYDVMFAFNRPYPLEQLQSEFGAFPGLRKVEYWGGARAAIVRSDGLTGNAFMVIAPNAGTGLVAQIPVVEGRWLLPSDRNALVVNQGVVSENPGLGLGDAVKLRLGKQESDWTIVGIAWEMMSGATAYANREYLNEGTGLGDSALFLVGQSTDRGEANVAAVTRAMEARLKENSMDVASTTRLTDLRTAIENHLLILASFLLLMSILVLIVGGLGLASTLSINVLERRREIGVLRAVGASGRDIALLVAGEGMMLGVISWILAVIAAEPAGRWITWTFGMTFFNVPLDFTYSVTGVLVWLGVVLLFAAGASLIPAYDASRAPVQEALVYE
ncbi:MAG: FtsX-like permease family protein [Anaerolineales bacterium]